LYIFNSAVPYIKSRPVSTEVSEEEAVLSIWRKCEMVTDSPFYRRLYMRCSYVSEYEHIYGPIFTTPSCVYDRLFTCTRVVGFNALIVWKTSIDICFPIKSSLLALTAACTKFRIMI